MTEQQLPASENDPLSEMFNLQQELKYALRKHSPHTAGLVPNYLFHYTSAEAFCGIVIGGKLWLTNAAYLSDLSELSYPADLAQEVVRSIAATCDNQGVRGILEKCLNRLASRTFYGPWYVASFSLEGDRLSQWRAYCPNGGYSFGLHGPSVDRILNGEGLVRGAVVYEEMQQRTCIVNLARQFMAFYKEIPTKHPSVARDEADDASMEIFTSEIARAALFFKRKAFEEEAEWRLLAPESRKRDVNFYVKIGQLTPYVQIDIQTGDNRIPFSKLSVAPLGNPDLTCDAARRLLESQQYSDAIIGLLKVPGCRIR